MRQIWVGCILLSTAVSSSAVTLGRHIGAAIIGRPLDVRVQLFLAPGEDMGRLCVGSDVFYGDAQVPASQVRSTPQKTAIDTEGFVRVQSLQAVNEPIVTIYVRASCTAPFTRRFVLLADPITESSVQTFPNARPATESRLAEGSRLAPERLPSVNTASAGGAAVQVQAAADPVAAVTVAQQPEAKPQPAVAPPPKPKPKPPSVIRRPAAPAPAPTPRLQLEPLDLEPVVVNDPVLKMSVALLSEPTSSDETRSAAALLWQAINASPEDILRDAQKLSVLESESKSLREAEAKSKAAMEALRGDLETAQADKYMNGLTYLLGGALLLALLALGALWRRRERAWLDDDAKIWWASEIKPQTNAMFRQTESAPLDVQSQPGPMPAPAMVSDRAEGGLSKEPRKVLDSEYPFFNSAPLPKLPDQDKRDFVHSSLTGASRSVATEELFDVQQKAEFFTSLGKDDEAVQVLLSHLNESQEPCALTYLDLLNIYHRLGRQGDYDHLRKEFNQVFNVGAPPFEQYSDKGQGLEAYETALTRIQALWPQPRVLELIEQSIFRDPQAATTEVFDLEAYRELLLLHAVAKDIIQREDAASRPPLDFPHTSVQPLKVTSEAQPKATRSSGVAARSTQKPFEFDAALPASPRRGLDIDLNDLSVDSSFAFLLPEDASERSAPPAHLATLPRAVRSAPLRDPNPMESFDFTLEDQDPPSPSNAGKRPPE